MWARLNAKIEEEPVAFQAMIQAALAMAMAFGFHMTGEQMAAVLVFTGAVLAFWTRKQVTSHANNPMMNKPPDP